jgi:hypothetical protein
VLLINIVKATGKIASWYVNILCTLHTGPGSRTRRSSLNRIWLISGFVHRFVSDLLKPQWPDRKANHIIQAVGASSLEKAKTFDQQHIAPHKPTVRPSLYGSYADVFNSPEVDCVYIGRIPTYVASDPAEAI